MTHTPPSLFTQNSNNRLPERSNVVLSPEIVPAQPEESLAQSLASEKLPPQAMAQPEGEWGIISRWWRGLGLKNQVGILAIALSPLPVLLVGTASYYFSNNNYWAVLGLGSGITAVLAGAIATLIVKRAMGQIQKAIATVNQLGQGELNLPLKDQKGDDLTFLQEQLNQLSQQLQTLFRKQSKITQQRQLFSSIAFRTRQSPKEEVLFQTTVQGARQILEADRVVIYRFNPDWTGTMVAESIVPGFPKVLNETIGDPCFRQRNAAQYQNGRIRAIDDIYTEPGLTDCHIRLLEQYRVRANLVVPIRKDEQLMGLLIAHQCSGPRSWNKSDIDFLSQLATEVEYGLDYISFINGQQ
ncbi:MAG: GAF domain-containing protein, partial [Xenococcaceae cyanobacterium MO_188.B32]|nr:GAF domain-containing protein [Xenococcaceae cyanobacterium MO_188.B32]